MKIVTLLHFYQPHNQQDDILSRIVNESYLPLTRGLLKNPAAKLVVNISGGLSELLLNKGYVEVINNLKELAERGQIEFTGSAKYHAFLPLLPKEEIERQVLLNNDINKKIFGDIYSPIGFFSPEMAVSDLVLGVVSQMGFKWIAAPQMSHPFGNPDRDKLYQHSVTGINIMYRHKRVSSLMLSSVCHDSVDFIKETTDLHNQSYWFAVMDAETFGHHRIGHETFLFDVLNNSFFEPTLVSDLLINTELKSNIETVALRPSTWTNQEQDFWLDDKHSVPTSDKSFILWRDPQNPLHSLQWQLLNCVLDTLKSYIDKESLVYKDARSLADKAISSDQFWWASLKPWWSLEMVESGAYELKNVLITLDPSLKSVKDAEILYYKIVDLAFSWQRTGYIRNKHLENSATYMRAPFYDRTPDEWFNQIILEFEDEMNLATSRQDFEKAIKWRDAIYKLNLGTDIYDVLHVVDELWTVRNIPSVKPFLKHNWNELSDFAKKHFRGLTNQSDFDNWVNNRNTLASKS